MPTVWTLWMFLIFVLFHGHSLGDELHPVYEAEDVLQRQPEWSSSDEIEPVEVPSRTESLKGKYREEGTNEVLRPKWAPPSRVPLQGGPIQGVPLKGVPLQRAPLKRVPPSGVLLQGTPFKGVLRQVVPPNGVHDETLPGSRNSPLSDANADDIRWIKEKIVDGYKFKKHATKDLWIEQPTFEGLLGTPQFKSDAERVEKFFKRNNDWEVTKNSPQFRKGSKCTDLLYITAARYLYVTYVLYLKSGGKLIPCSNSATDRKKISIPVSGVCYPKPYGTASCTSDYDVGLIGKDTGTLTKNFNEYFQNPKTGFGKPSELVFDTNVYAFTLEYAMPYLFTDFPNPAFAKNVEKEENTVKYRMQEVASAYYKVFKYNEDFFKVLKAGAEEEIKAVQSKKALNDWLKHFADLNTKVPMKLGNGKGPSRKDHNDVYQKRVEDMSKQGGYKADLLGKLAEALIYAAEAYHTRGAIRHVVGTIQMDGTRPLSNNDLWVSMIENWGDAIKEYNHCKNDAIKVCFLKMSKYLWRVFNAMKIMYYLKILPPFVLPFNDVIDPEALTKSWLDYKKAGRSAIPNQQIIIQKFLKFFECFVAVKDISKPFSPEGTCLTKMNTKINEYNKAMASIIRD